MKKKKKNDEKNNNYAGSQEFTLRLRMLADILLNIF